MQERHIKENQTERKDVVWLVDGDRLLRVATAHLRTPTKVEQTLENISAGGTDHFKKILQRLTKGAFDDLLQQPGPDEWDDIPDAEESDALQPK